MDEIHHAACAPPFLFSCDEISGILETRMGGVSEKSDSVGGFEPPPPCFKNGLWGVFKGVFRRRHTIFAKFFFGGILLDCTSKVLSLPPIQPLLILSP